MEHGPVMPAQASISGHGDKIFAVARITLTGGKEANQHGKHRE